MSKDNGGPAFPVDAEFDERHGEYVRHASSGMTLRDYFAAKVLPTLYTSDGKIFEYWCNEYGLDDAFKFAAERAYRQADAMLKARAE